MKGCQLLWGRREGWEKICTNLRWNFIISKASRDSQCWQNIRINWGAFKNANTWLSPQTNYIRTCESGHEYWYFLKLFWLTLYRKLKMIWTRFDSQTWLHIVTTSKSLKNTPANHGWFQKHDIEQKKKKGGKESQKQWNLLCMTPFLFHQVRQKKKNSMRLKTIAVISSGKRGMLAQTGKRKHSRLILELI